MAALSNDFYAAILAFWQSQNRNDRDRKSYEPEMESR